MEEPWNAQRSVIGSITRVLDNVKKLGKNNYTPAMLKNRMAILQDYWKDCQRLNAKIETTATKEERNSHEYFVNQMFLRAEDSYINTSDYLASWIDKFTKSLPTNNGSAEASVSEQPHFAIQLPRIVLPKFSGDYTDWENFKDIFESLVVNNDNLSNVQRLHYLKASLIDDAKLVLKNVSVTEANYNSAWELLKNRYDNPRIIINAHLQSFVDLPCLNSSSVKELRSLRDKTNDALTALKNLKRPVEHWDDLIVFILVQKLDKTSRKEWEFKLGDQNDNPTFKDLDSFLSARIRALEAVSSNETGSNAQMKTKQTKPKLVNSHQSNTETHKCILCNENHFLYQCKSFKDKSIEQRYEFLKMHKRCFNCLNGGHFPSSCYSKHVCKVCKGKHHTLLHKENTQATRTNNDEPLEHNNSNSSEAEADTNSHFSKYEETKEPKEVNTTLLPTAYVLLKSDSGRSIKVRALLDQGSQSTFVSESVAQYLKARRKQLSISVSGIGGASIGKVRGAVSVTLAPCDQVKPGIAISALVLPKLTSYMPKLSFIKCSWPHLAKLKLADPEPSNSLPIELLIGADLYGRILMNGVLQGPKGSPTAQLTIFGWIVSGSIGRSSEISTNPLVAHLQTSDESVEELLRKFWEIEEVPATSMLTEEEAACETFFQKTVGRRSDGRYIVRLPFKTEAPIPIGESKHIAERIFSRNESKLQQQPEILKQYREFMDEYENLHHMEKLHDDRACEHSTQVVYFPHHPVIRECSQTTKLRVVFNASCATSNGSSLNDFLHVGPKLQADLVSLILRWRAHPYVYTADIEKMFRQILIHPADTDYQRILWRSTPCDELSSFRLLTVTYGTACAPFLANRVLKQLAKDDGDAYPLAAPVLENCTYVDDIMFGATDIVLAKQIQSQLTRLLKAGGFNLRKWASNSMALLSDIPTENHGLATDKSLQIDEHLKVLGTAWNPRTDSFRFYIDINGYSNFTKRLFLSLVSRMFDPLGWASPFSINAKILLQIFWIRKLKWDEPLPDDLAERCLSYQSQLLLLRKIEIPRWTGQSNEPQQYQLHGFADASNAAYAAAIYLRVESLDGTVRVALLIAKTKVAPLKVQSIPRLELCAAVLLARLVQFTQTEMQLPNIPIF
ncbi:uncharacterized protein LOC108631691, partial [Ceratina calcarata]|uniref:Uncharacterized protein LOC108631691 n=2 Tax=Ceratina calcarata TaxID=156304 RepID=A0AAJ7JE21_9HYME